MTDTLRFYQDPFRDTRWRVEAPNGEVTLASTEGYVKAVDALANAQRYLLMSPTHDPNVWTVHATEEVNAIAEDLNTTPAKVIDPQPAQYSVTTIVDGQLIGRQDLADPFVTATVTIGLEDLRRAVEEERDLVVTVRVDGSRAAIRHVMRPMDLTPNDEQPQTFTEAATSQAAAGE